jgi:sensor histidine kinase YesM
MVIAYFAARHITNPIDLICKQVASFRLDQNHRKVNLHSKIYELNSLNEGFFDMQEKLRDSINRQILLQTQEMQSKMLALQSQMNPHFLFNSMSAIQSMAEDGMDEEIVIMCQAIANLLRYISADSDQLVPLETELSYTENYFACMIIRYQGDLSYSIDVPEEMLHIKIPKLCIQLLVENAIKFSASIKPPWRIIIKGFVRDNCYYISVIDNGPGFDPQTILDIEEKIRQIDISGMLPSLEIKGMGLMNIYIRLKILNSSNFTFKLENLEGGGASITIGGWHEG